MKPRPEQIQEEPIADYHGALEDDDFIPNNEDGMIVLPEENIVSEEEDFVETEYGEHDDDTHVPEHGEHDDDTHVPEVAMEESLVAVAPLDDMEIKTVGSTRPKRSNSGAGVEIIQMDFSGKGYGAKRQFTLVTNGVKVHPNTTKEEYTYMKTALDVVFTQMTANAGIKKFGEPAVAAMIKEFSQLNEGAVPGKPVVVPTDARTLTVMEKQKALPAVNLIKEK